MVRPITFGFDEQTAKTNSFQNNVSMTSEDVRAKACAEFDAAVEPLRSKGIAVTVFTDDDPQPKPNTVFLNNWLSMWPDGAV